MFKFKKVALLVSSLLLSSSALATTTPDATTLGHNKSMNQIEVEFFEKVSNMLSQGNSPVYSVSQSEIPDFFEVYLSDGNTIMVNSEGTTGIVSNRSGIQIYDFTKRESLTKNRKGQLALNYISNNKPLVTYPAAEQKAVVSVFTDIQCGYCQLLHDNIPELNEKGITVQYYPVPFFEGSALLMNAAFCSENPKESFTDIMNASRSNIHNSKSRVELAGGSKDDYKNEVKQGKDKLTQLASNIIRGSDCVAYDMDYALYSAKGLGVVGTPNILFEDGDLVEGKMDVSAILEKVQIKN